MFQRFIYTPEHFSRNLNSIAPHGAVGRNAEWEQSRSGNWYIEQQRAGNDLVAAGILFDQAAILERGWRCIEWGLDHLAADGSFAGSNDLFHSASLFIESAARTVLMMRQANCTPAAGSLDEAVARLARAAHWLLGPAATDAIMTVERNMTHRMYILAGAIGQSGTLANDPTLIQRAMDYAEEGLRMQRDDGVNPERGGSDVNYQQAGALMAMRYLTVCPDTKLADRIIDMVHRAISWEITHIDAAGDVDTGKSTRVGVEPGRSGTIKTVNYKELIQALVFGGMVTGELKFLKSAEAMISNRLWPERIARLFPHQPD